MPGVRIGWLLECSTCVCFMVRLWAGFWSHSFWLSISTVFIQRYPSFRLIQWIEFRCICVGLSECKHLHVGPCRACIMSETGIIRKAVCIHLFSFFSLSLSYPSLSSISCYSAWFATASIFLSLVLSSTFNHHDSEGGSLAYITCYYQPSKREENSTIASMEQPTIHGVDEFHYIPHKKARKKAREHVSWWGFNKTVVFTHVPEVTEITKVRCIGNRYILFLRRHFMIMEMAI